MLADLDKGCSTQYRGPTDGTIRSDGNAGKRLGTNALNNWIVSYPVALTIENDYDAGLAHGHSREP
jgi:hypothetical protein